MSANLELGNQQRCIGTTNRITNGCMFEVWLEKKATCSQPTAMHVELMNFACGVLGADPTSCRVRELMRNVIHKFLSRVRSRWEKCRRRVHLFRKLNSNWLKNEVNIPSELFNTVDSASSDSEQEEELSTDGEGPNKPRAMTGLEALALIISAKFTRRQYYAIRRGAIERNCKIYPSCEVIENAKKTCYPPKESITISETSAEIKLQNILDQTACRIIENQMPVLESMLSNLNSLKLICKWGYAGSSGQSQYKQRMTGENQSDSDIFIVCFVPLQLFQDIDDKKCILWQNPMPSSTRFCRPIKLLFHEETIKLAQEEIKRMENQIKGLVPYKFAINDKNLEVNYQLVMTMVDENICSDITSTKSAQLCYICGASPEEMNMLEKVSEKQIDASTFCFGLSALHAYIRFFECCLHISYRVEIKKWQARTPEDKLKVASRKKIIVGKFRSEFGLLVDQPKPGGSGTSNDGNTAWTFFCDPTVSASITGVDERLIHRFSVLLNALSSGFEINLKSFDDYAIETAKLYVELYSWYPMPTSVHKVLIHGSSVIQASILPIGELSEDSQEARNKKFKKIREGLTQESSIVNTNKGVLNRLLLTSDPLISRMSYNNYQKTEKISHEVSSLLAIPHREEIDYSTSSSGSSDSE